MYIFFCRLTIGLVLESYTMVASCVAYGCTERKGNNLNVSFHRFPDNDQEWLQKWIQAIRWKDWVPTKAGYGYAGYGHRLYDHAVSSIFPSFPQHLQKSSTRRKSPKKRKFEEKATCSETSPSKISRFIKSDHAYAGKALNVSEQLKALEKQVKALKAQVSR